MFSGGVPGWAFGVRLGTLQLGADVHTSGVTRDAVGSHAEHSD